MIFASTLRSGAPTACQHRLSGCAPLPLATCAARSILRVFLSSFSSVLRSVLSAPPPGFFPVFFLRLSLRVGRRCTAGVQGV
jgi:hypothetical protein